jgi:hypothetical protein
VQSDIAAYYESSHPGQVRVLGADLYNGTPANLGSFRTQTGATFPLLLLGATATGGNLSTLYGTFDNYVVINKQGIVRYHAAQIWPHGNRYHLDEIRGCVDSLVTATVDVPPTPGSAAARLTAAPNPSSGPMRIELATGGADTGEARVDVVDLAGRIVATLAPSARTPGRAEFLWDGRTRSGAPARAGVYLLRAEAGGVRLTRRVVRTR